VGARRSLRSVFVAVAAVAAVMLGGLPARAEPGITEIERQIEEASTQLEHTVEQYNGVTVQLKQTKAEVEALNTKIKPLQEKVDETAAKVGVIAVQAYKGGYASATNIVLASGTQGEALGRLLTLDMLARGRQLAIADVAAAKAPLDREKAKLDALLVQQTKAEQELGTRKTKITTDIGNLQGLWKQAGGPRAGRAGPCPPEYVPGRAGTVVKYACAQLGRPYVWADEGRSGFDCSGLTLAAWRQVNVELPHYTVWQWDKVKHIPAADRQPGDLVFYYSDLHHVALYLGGNKIVHAPNFGVPVSVDNVDYGGAPVYGYGRPG